MKRRRVVFGTFDVACDDGFTAEAATLQEAQSKARAHIEDGCRDVAVSIVQEGWEDRGKSHASHEEETPMSSLSLSFAPQAVVRFTSKHSFRTGWRWGPDMTNWFVQETSRLDLERPLVHLCSGSSRLGDIRVDAAHPLATIKADVFHLPFQDASVPTIIVDPPYEWDLRERTRFGKELARVHRPGGRLLWKAPWLPFEGHYRIHDVTASSIRAGLPRNAHLLVRAERRYPGPKQGQGQRKKREATT